MSRGTGGLPAGATEVQRRKASYSLRFGVCRKSDRFCTPPCRRLSFGTRQIQGYKFARFG
jgi:hypothetical protein